MVNVTVNVQMGRQSFVTACMMLALSLSLGFTSQVSFAQSIDDYAAVPPSGEESTAPLMMLVMSRDNQLWHKAYNDYSDLDGDLVLDTSYKDNFEYYGYFNSGWCYRYVDDGLNSRYSPSNPVVAGSHRCPGTSALWSGNFLNWLTTTRIDVVRKVLYGGYRAVDETNRTVLQRAFIPNDNHAFVKIVRNSDLDTGSTIADFTPIDRTAAGDVVSFCNVTDYDYGTSPLSRNINISQNLPKLKVAMGAHPTWAGSERNQCMYRGESSAGGEGGDAAFTPARPSAITGLPVNSEMAVRVDVCVANRDAVDEDACRTYVDTNGTVSVKPFGVLQEHGELGAIRFGLMTGSYANNTQGGVLRKNISFLGGPGADEDDLEINTRNGVFLTQQQNSNPGIIKTLNTLRIQGWNYNDSTYADCNRPGILKSQLGSENETRCRDWGNPISEIYLEALRYLSGRNLAPTSAFNGDDSNIVPGLVADTWADPYLADAACSKCSIVVLSTGLNNFDGDGLNSATDLSGISSVTDLKAFTNRIGGYEGLDTGKYVVGRNGVDENDERCTAKDIPSLSDAQGACPEVPSLEGSFNIAGAAFYAHENDLRPNLTGQQTVKTFTVSLAESIPTFEIPVGNEQSISFVPTCHSSLFYAAVPGANSGWSPCTLVDLTVVEQTPVYGQLLISWEDSLWGNDYDMDAYVVLEYCTARGNARQVREQCPSHTDQESPRYHDDRRDYEPDNSNGFTESGYDYSQYEERPDWRATTDENGTLQLRVSVLAASAGFAMKFGYIVNGSGSDGSYDDQILRYGGYDYNSSALTGTDDNMVIWDRGDEAVVNSKVTRRFAPSADTPRFLKNPLWYAAKYGNFTDLAGGTAGVPDQQEEWDNLDLNGQEVAGGDGYPDAYFPVKNPARLPIALSEIFRKASAKVASGTSASVNAQTSSGEGAIYQALYSPSVESDLEGESEVRWVGALNALFMDSYGNIRDDSGATAAQLDAGDRIIEIQYDDREETTFIARYEFNTDGSRGDPVDRLTFDGRNFNPIWSAREQLEAQVDDDATPAVNRGSVRDNAASGRFVFTAIDRDGDGVITSTSGIGMEIRNSNPGQSGNASTDVVFAFEASNFLPALGDHHYLDLNDDSEASVAEMVNYIRGIEVEGLRTRTVNDDLYLLGDIIHSSPVSVGRPQDRYDLIYGDATYRAFFERYKNRRNMVYVGANDGMLHAFNAGFFDSARMAFDRTPNNDTSFPSHPLGSELWAYVPYNVIPHLKWLASPDYPHVYYVDGPVQSFDVNIWPADDSVHTNGWGTIIVVGLRLGGGEYSLDHNGVVDDEPRSTRSAYIVMDVTDPERNPELIAEISHPDLGYTTSLPTLMKARSVSEEGGSLSVTQNEWHLVFGSGPRGIDSGSRRDALVRGVSTMPATLFSFDLRRKVLVESILEGDSGADSRELNSYVGNFTSADWNLDYIDDAIYFGLVSGSPTAPGGKLKRGVIDFSDAADRLSAVDDFFNPGLPFSSTPLALRDANSDFWVYAGTGRYLATADNDSEGQQSYFGLKEPKNEDNSLSFVEIDDDELFDTTNIDVYTDGRVREDGAIVRLTARCTGNLNTDDAENFDDIVEYIEDCAGWFFDFTTPPRVSAGAAVSNPLRIRTTTKTALAGQSLVIAAFEPVSEHCSVDGLAYVYTPHRLAGIPGAFAPLGVDSSRTLPATESGEPDELLVLSGAEFGHGVPSDPTVIISRGNTGPGNTQSECDEYTALNQNRHGEVERVNIQCDPIPAGRRGWAEIPVTW